MSEIYEYVNEHKRGDFAYAIKLRILRLREKKIYHIGKPSLPIRALKGEPVGQDL